MYNSSSLPFPLWQSLSSRPIYLSVLGAQQRNKQVVPPLHNNLIEPKQSLCCGCASIQFPVPSSALSPLAFNLVLLHVHSFSKPIHPPLSSPWDHPISRTGTRTLCVSLYSFMGYIMHPIKIPVEVDFRCEMATKVSLNMSFSPPSTRHLLLLLPWEVTAFNKLFVFLATTTAAAAVAMGLTMRSFISYCVVSVSTHDRRRWSRKCKGRLHTPVFGLCICLSVCLAVYPPVL